MWKVCTNGIERQGGGHKLAKLLHILYLRNSAVRHHIASRRQFDIIYTIIHTYIALLVESGQKGKKFVGLSIWDTRSYIVREKPKDYVIMIFLFPVHAGNYYYQAGNTQMNAHTAATVRTKLVPAKTTIIFICIVICVSFRSLCGASILAKVLSSGALT